MMIPLEAFFLLRMATATGAVVGWSLIYRSRESTFLRKGCFLGGVLRCRNMPLYLLPTYFDGVPHRIFAI